MLREASNIISMCTKRETIDKESEHVRYMKLLLGVIVYSRDPANDCTSLKVV